MKWKKAQCGEHNNDNDPVQDEVEERAQDGEHERHAHASDASSPSLRSPSTSPGSKTIQKQHKRYFDVASLKVASLNFASLTVVYQVIPIGESIAVNSVIYVNKLTLNGISGLYLTFFSKSVDY
jgi:hypothetical protein